MSVEHYYAPTTKALRLPLAEVAARFAAAGLPCAVEPEAKDMFWLVFDPHESALLASVEGGAFVFGTFHAASVDPPEVGETVEEVMTSLGFSADEDADY